jgi:hypothetical protein
MKTRLARILAAAAATLGLSMAGLAATAAPASAASLCSTDCISGFTVKATTKAITADVTTTGFVKVTGEIWNSARTARVGYLVDDQPLTWERTWPLRQSSITTVSQNTYYAVKVTATDMLGATYTEWRNVRVKQRTATWHITKINLSDDSDSAGAGEFKAGWKAGTTVKSPIWSGSWSFSSSNAATTIVRVGESSSPKVFLELLDDDTDIGDFGCGTGFSPAFNWGSNSCADWATAGAQVALPETSATTSFTLYVAKTAPVKFTVQGYVVTTVL